MEQPGDKEVSQQEELQIAISEAQLRKLELEISSLEWHNSLLGRLARFATLFTITATAVTILATLFSVWQGYSKFMLDKENDLSLRKKELIERNDTQYRAYLQQLLQYPVDDKQTTPQVIFAFRNLSNIIEQGYDKDDSEKRRREVATLIANLIRSLQFDLMSARNVEFAQIAVRECGYFKERLIDNPEFNMAILSKFDLASKLYVKEDAFYKSIQLDPKGDYAIAVPDNKRKLKITEFVNLLDVYREYIELVNKNLNEKPQVTEETRNDLEAHVCSFYSTTNNNNLTMYVFNIPDNELQNWLNECQRNAAR